MTTKPNPNNELLFELIKSLTKAEKRHFKVYTSRLGSDKLFVQLFDLLNISETYDSAYIIKKLPRIRKSQLPNVKAILFKELLVSLRLMHVKYEKDIELREKLDHVRILYNKGFYRPSLDRLKKVKAKAYQFQYFHIVAEIIDFEKYIESQHITNSIREQAQLLSSEADSIHEHIKRINIYSNLSIKLYGRYLKKGHIQNESEAEELKKYFYSNLPSVKRHKLNFLEQLYLIQSNVWYHYMRQDFVNYYKYARSWVNLFDSHTEMMHRFRPTYFKGIHNLLTSLFMTNSRERFAEAFELLQLQLEDQKSYSENEISLLYLFLHIHKINEYFMEGSFSEGVENIGELKFIITENKYNWDKHRIMVFRYKIACLFFGSGDNDTCIDYLTDIINEQSPSFKEDILCFSRILRLLAHYELGNILLINDEIKSVFRFLIKMNSPQGVIREVLAFMRKTPRMTESQVQEEFINLRDRLVVIQNDKYEALPYLYLDIISWLESKIEDKPVQEIVRRKFIERSMA